MNKWYGYVHENKTFHVKRFFGDYGDILEVHGSPFVIFATEPFSAKNRENALKILKQQWQDLFIDNI
jgi:hypothetical protein